MAADYTEQHASPSVFATARARLVVGFLMIAIATQVEELRGAPLNVGNLEEIIDEKYAWGSERATKKDFAVLILVSGRAACADALQSPFACKAALV